MSVKVGFLHTIIRPEEKMLIKELQSRKDVELEMIDVRTLHFNLTKMNFEFDVIFERCINHSRALHALLLYESAGIPCVNTSKVATVCGDKLLTSIALKDNNVPQPEVSVAFTEDTAVRAIEEIGYPVVLKPAVGSWGRLISKINDRDAAETILEHKTILGTYHHSIFYIQKYIQKNGRDIRAFVVDDKCIAAIYRTSEHWLTNTSRGAVASNCPITDELSDISIKAARAVGGGAVAIDIFESDNGLLANEVNYTMEFRNSITTTGVDIPKHLVDYVIKVAQRGSNGKN
ncbi:lysine biosynthesis protein LysX [candidate division KSB1 bacterium]|nr:lysine biosynthesis protein LysX [candidate division KSB1 bacterium]MBL7094566.1 lysine biosynthesis protein LysX [candidate division KSB1 bacterium]